MEDKNIKGMRKYKNKQGEEVIKEYNQTAYNKKFYEKHKEDINKKCTCVCGGSYTKSNRTKHDKGRYHSLYALHNTQPKRTLHEIEEALNAVNTY
tara:strand:- start:464 stop:748 length:285 start_codon:yes stop_codon:yes gene_type:complete